MCNSQKGALLPKSALTRLFSKEKIEAAGCSLASVGDILTKQAGTDPASVEMNRRNKPFG